MNKYKRPNAVSQSIITKFSVDKDVKSIDTWHRLNTQYGN